MLADGRRQIIAFFLPGDICGYLEGDKRCSFDGEAITTVETCSFNRASASTPSSAATRMLPRRCDMNSPSG